MTANSRVPVIEFDVGIEVEDNQEDNADNIMEDIELTPGSCNPFSINYLSMDEASEKDGCSSEEEDNALVAQLNKVI